MRDSVIFCKVDSYGFPHWNGVDFLRWKTLPTNWRFDTGTAHLWIYKTAWLVYHRNMLKNRLRKPKSLYCCWLVSLQQRWGDARKI